MKNNEFYILTKEDNQIIKKVLEELKGKQIVSHHHYQAKLKTKKQLTSNIEDDIFSNNPVYSEKTLNQEQHIFKMLKLYYFPKATPQEKHLYLKYFCEECPWLIKRLTSNITEIQKNKIFNKALQIAKQTKNDFIAENSRLVMSIVYKEYYNVKIPKVDLIQEGTFGLEVAVEKFDLSKGCKFSGYATQWIRHTLNRYNENNSRAIRLPNRVFQFLLQLNKAENDMSITLKRMPTDEELAEKLNVPVDKIIKVKDYRTDIVSLDAAMNTEDEEELEKFLKDPKTEEEYNGIENSMFNERFKQILEDIHLSERAKSILYSYYGTDKPVLQKIAKDLGISRETARKAKNEGMDMLKKSKQMKELAIEMGIISEPLSHKTYSKKI